MLSAGSGTASGDDSREEPDDTDGKLRDTSPVGVYNTTQSTGAEQVCMNTSTFISGKNPYTIGTYIRTSK